MDLDLRHKVAIVGGASRGIGYGIARTLAVEGARVAITARRDPGLSDAARTIRAESRTEVLPILADCRRGEDCARVIATVASRLGGVDILVNNDGAPPLGELTSFDDPAWASHAGDADPKFRGGLRPGADRQRPHGDGDVVAL